MSEFKAGDVLCVNGRTIVAWENTINLGFLIYLDVGSASALGSQTSALIGF